MKEGLAKRIADLVEGASKELERSILALREHTPENALALYRLNVAAILGTAVSRVLIPIWRDHPELEPREAPDQTGLDPASFVIAEETARAGIKALETVRGRIESALSLIRENLAEGDERSGYEAGLQDVLGRVTEAASFLEAHRRRRSQGSQR